ncbi:hypothetical protein [Candidatus Enterovibrio escicola]|uniref:hypothetical protein n=1 Tax=Candidatus Enterovibrio escicola TaxID=1927127 RepID=UPI001CC2613B|nr:hypothetical protein [Candidatus Enterovibrio escacola]
MFFRIFDGNLRYSTCTFQMPNGSFTAVNKIVDYKGFDSTLFIGYIELIKVELIKVELIKVELIKVEIP